MHEKTTKSIYNVWSAFYDWFWPTIVHRRIRRAIDQMGILAGERVLDVGVGTGLSLPHYPTHAEVVGLDLSEGMLRHARRRVRQHGLQQKHLMVANALELPFADSSFDHVLLSLVVSVVSDPVRLIAEVRRVVRPNGQIVIINHFQSPNRLVAMIEQWLCPVFQHIGWRSDICVGPLLDQAGLAVDYRYKLDSVDLWQTIFATNRPVAAPDTGNAAAA
jgi:phosphatidylethanolamine/phosphatidyl-N-methylethanolamine N-methyltransferase